MFGKITAETDPELTHSVEVRCAFVSDSVYEQKCYLVESFGFSLGSDIKINKR